MLHGCGSAFQMGVPVHIQNVNTLPLNLYDALTSDFVSQVPTPFVSAAERYCGQGAYAGSNEIPGTMTFTNGTAGSVNVTWRLPCRNYDSLNVSASHGTATYTFRISQDGSTITPVNDNSVNVDDGDTR